MNGGMSPAYSPAPIAGGAALRWRQWRSRLMLALTAVATAAVLAPLALILYQVVVRGAAAFSPALFLRAPAPVGETGGGLGNAMVGTVELLVIALVVGIPVGVAGGVYAAEHGRERFTTVVRFAADVLNGIPTIVTGLFVYAVVVISMHSFSAIAGGLALAIILIPVMLRASEEVLRALPRGYRQAALALGASQRQVTFSVLLPAAKTGLISGGMLALARVAGETAPLLFTAFGNDYWSSRLDRPIAALTVQIFDYALSPYKIWHQQAWAGSLVLIAGIVAVGALARLWAGRGRP